MTTFTPEQSAAIHTDARHAIILAPAGSGKTRVLTERLAHLLRNGVGATNIMALTFTRRAAAEMEERTVKALGGDDAAKTTVGDITMGTVHSVCLDIIKLYAPRLGYHDGVPIDIIDEADADMLLEDVAESLGVKRPTGWRHGLSFRQIKRACEAQYAGTKDNVRRKAVAAQAVRRVIDAFHIECRKLHALTFGLILTECQRLLKDNPDVLATLQARYTHILVDECQDSASVEYSLYETLGAAASTFLVGDLRQSIFSFRYARPDMLKTWIAERDPEIHDLRRCFRCGDVIVEAANRLIAHNTNDPGDPMIGETKRTGSICTYEGPGEHIVGLIQNYMEETPLAAYGQVAVIARKHSVLERVEKDLTAHGIPCNRVGRANAICRTESWLRLMAAIRLVCNPRDRLAFMRLAKVWGITRYEVGLMECKARSLQLTLWEAFLTCGYKATDAAAHTIRDAQPTDTDQNWLARLGRVIGADLGDEMTFAMNTMFNIWPKDGSIRDLLFAARLAATYTGEDFRQGDAVTLLTGHASKGLEFPAVIVADCNQGVFPSAISMREGNVEEERRIFYVSVTRARETLMLHYWGVEDQEAADAPEVRPPSQFLEECGQAVTVQEDAA
ncbi:MAG TPA: ATP-dependent helicase [Phycisphaerae bacterium]|nr:ATP-dependent helicase [Phycisphaerae bacterium]